MAEKATPIENLMQYMNACCIARGNASWTQGYRARFEAGRLVTSSSEIDAEQRRLYEKEQAQWRYCSEVEARFRKYASHLLRKARKPKPVRPLRRRRARSDG